MNVRRVHMTVIPVLTVLILSVDIHVTAGKVTMETEKNVTVSEIILLYHMYMSLMVV